MESLTEKKKQTECLFFSALVKKWGFSVEFLTKCILVLKTVELNFSEEPQLQFLECKVSGEGTWHAHKKMWKETMHDMTTSGLFGTYWVRSILN